MTQYNKKDALELVQDSLAKSRRESDLDWTDIKDKHPIMEHSSDILRRYSTGWKLLEDWGLVDFSQININTESENMPVYKETTEILAGGVQRSDKLIKMNDKQSKDVEYMLKAHGFDPNEFELISVKNNIWNTNSKTQGVQTLYSSKISVKPKVDGFNVDKFLEKIKDIKPKLIKRPDESTKSMITVPFVDQHFGINDFNHYERKLNDTVELFESKKWDTIYIPIGNDLLHVNTHKGQTANGTQIENVNLEKAKEDAYKFYSIIFDHALANAKNVVAHYVQGNHDADITWMFVTMLSKLYPQIEWDTSMEVKKFFKWENILLVNLHGDRGLNRVVDALVSEYRDLVVGAKTVEVHSGHLHAERVFYKNGILVRTLPTDAETDSWHRSNTFEGAVKVSQILEYNEYRLKTIHYL